MMEVDQNQVEGDVLADVLCFHPCLEQLELALASWPLLLPADKLLTTSQTAFEGQVSSFACHRLSPLWHLYETVPHMASVLMCH